ncbi:hypothetical protein AQ1_01057 [alpha proteobacterium Q-1]|nr:hypothetical protein AQ1_01057 [alpha proteobacterium Q-1]
MKRLLSSITPKIVGAIMAGSVLMGSSSARAQGSAETIPDLAAHAAASYRQQARFPAWSQPVARGAVDPVLAERIPTRQILPSESGMGLSVWPDDMRFESGDEARLYARLESTGKNDEDLLSIPNADGATGPWQISAVVTGQLSGPLGTISYQDDGRNGDEQAGDGIYTARFTLPEAFDPLPGYAENIAVVVTANNGKGEEYKGITGFLYSHPAARLTGQYVEKLVDGDLVISAEIEATTKGRFHLSGTMHSLRGVPLVTAQSAENLDAGTHWIDLRFYGLALSEAGAKGPLTLGSVTLASIKGLPNALGPVLHDVYRTMPFVPEQFHSRSFDRPDLMEQARRLDVGRIDLDHQRGDKKPPRN